MRALVICLLILNPLWARALGDMLFSAEPQSQSSFALGTRAWHGANQGDQSYDGLRLEAPVLQWNLALGERAEGVLGISALRFLRGGEPEIWGGGDPYFYTKLLLLDGQPSFMPWSSQLSFIWGVLEPAANRPLGDDRLTFYAILAYGWQSGDWRWDLNYGAAIAESFSTNNQIDIIETGLRVQRQVHPEHVLALEYFHADRVIGHWLDISKAVPSPFARRQWQAQWHYGEQQQWRLALGSGLIPESGGLLGSVAYHWYF